MKFITLLLALCLLSVFAWGQTELELNSQWYCRQKSALKDDMTKISSAEYALSDWMPATVPGTVLTTMVNNHLQPDPYFGRNNDKIPDIFAVGKDYYTYCFVRDFDYKTAADRQVWLNLRGVNYAFDAYLNGKKINLTLEKGMFLRHRYCITPFLRKEGNNRLAIIVYPPDVVGNPNGGQGGDGQIARNVTLQYVAGWDWIQPVRDRNTGIWDKVSIEQTGPIAIQQPHVITKVIGKRDPDAHDQQPASLLFQTELENSAAKPVLGRLELSVDGKTYTRQVKISAGEKKLLSLDEISILHPKLWWPHNYGTPYLYTVKIRFIIENKISDEKIMHIGIRQIDHHWNTHTRSMEIAVNGQPVFIQGGNWVISDAMLRFSKERYDAEIRFHRDMHLNMIRIWGGAITERPEFYEACDKYGMLVFQDFWGSGDCNGRWLDPMKKDDQYTRRQYPDDHALFIQSAADQICMIRNYASLAVWCGGNEITLPADIHHALKDSLMPLLDGTRWFVDYSNSDSMSYNAFGGNGDGPYTIQPVSTFWQLRSWPFNSEIGSVGVGDYASLQRIFPQEDLVVPDEAHLNADWAYHKYIEYKDFIKPYGTVKNLKDWTRKAQLVNYDQYRSLMEGFTSHQWDWYTGFMIWKTQNPWTALRGQMYDTYLDPNACLYGLRTGGRSLHVMFSPADSTVHIANNTVKHFSDVLLSVHWIGIDGRDSLLTQVFTDNIALNSKYIMPLGGYLKPLANKEGGFLVLRLQDADKELIDENLYWMADSTGDYSGLQHLAETHLDTDIKVLSAHKLQITFHNPTGGPVAFFNRISILDQQTGQRILPTFYSDNYFSILPGDVKTIEVECPSLEKYAQWTLETEGWNVARNIITVNK